MKKRLLQSNHVNQEKGMKIHKPSSSTSSFTTIRGSTVKNYNQLTIGRFGIRKKLGPTFIKNEGTIRIFPDDHLSHKDEDFGVKVCGSAEIIHMWYNELPKLVVKKFEQTGFKCLIDGLSDSKPDSALIQCLAEKWWDTTHTFHFENMGEMTMTPVDFSAISGLRVNGKVVHFEKFIYKNNKVLLKYLGTPIKGLIGKSVEIKALRQAYQCLVCKTSQEEDILLRAFIIALLGATIFANTKNRVNFYCLPMLKDLNEIEKYNWGGAGLAFLYEQMDDISRCNTNKIGGLWKAWEIWAREYIPAARVIQASSRICNFPFSLRWKHIDTPFIEIPLLLQYYRIKFLHLLQHEVNWSPWGDEQDFPEIVKQSVRPTQSRVLMLGPFGGEWYLGERVLIQSMKTNSFYIPKPPPPSMLLVHNLSTVIDEWAVYGKPVMEFVQNIDNTSYEEYRRQWSTFTHDIQAKIHRGQSSISEENEMADDIIPMPPWTLLLPSTFGGPNIICIPKDIGIQNLEIPPHVRHISVVTAKKLLSMIGGMQHVLIEQLTNARDLLRDYTVIIQKLKHELDVKTNTTEEDEPIIQADTLKIGGAKFTN